MTLPEHPRSGGLKPVDAKDGGIKSPTNTSSSCNNPPAHQDPSEHKHNNTIGDASSAAWPVFDIRGAITLANAGDARRGFIAARQFPGTFSL